MKKVLLIFGLTVICAGAKAQCSELFFSKYIQFGGNNKGLEIYNPTANPINLTGYSIQRFKANSSGLISTTMNDSLNLSGVIPAHGTWVVINGQTVDVPLSPSGISPRCDSALQTYADQLDHIYGYYGSSVGQPTYFKGNDALMLMKNNQMVDIFGEVGVTVKFWSTLPTYRGQTGEGKWITKGYMMERRPAVTNGIATLPGSFNPLGEWDTIPMWLPTGPMVRQDTLDIYSLFGSHTCDCATIGIKTNDKNNTVAVYPNPSAIGSVTIKSPEVISEIKLFNLTGQLVLSEAGINKLQLSVNTERISKGAYLLVVYFKNGFSERKNITIE